MDKKQDLMTIEKALIGMGFGAEEVDRSTDYYTLFDQAATKGLVTREKFKEIEDAIAQYKNQAK